ncbi:hypothetical protein [Rhizohabitans arisaemae]|uniref:hypothetical protein n=1 Tax=Rhizohabitans arisaemae TaxID=2720610 RepID=UPI0024B19A5C|nr:hypothetical protein [Rhizohabitans arisaemae]
MHLIGDLVTHQSGGENRRIREPFSLAIRLLRSLKEREHLSGRRDVLEAFEEYLARPNGKSRGNPEIYPFLHALRDHDRTPVEIDECLRRLALHLGLSPRSAPGRPPGGYWRLCHSHDAVLTLRQNRLEDVFPTTAVRLTEDLVAMYPRTGLFADLIPADLYPAGDAPGPTDPRVARVTEALRLIRAFSPVLAADFAEVVRTIVITPSLATLPRRSYSCRLTYFGGIFVDASEEDVGLVAEGLLHEYAHQELWRLWEFRPEAAVPAPGAPVRSPLTGRLLGRDVMTHAYLIYLEAARFNAWLADRRSGDDPEAYGRRAAELGEAARRLGEGLGSQTPGDPALREILEFGRSWSDR